MNAWVRGIVVLSAMATMSPLARAQAITTFDGTYRGVSTTASGSAKCVVGSPVPGTLTIQNGAAQVGRYRETVTATGTLSMHNDRGTLITARIDPGGKISGGSLFGDFCTITSVWQKQ